MMNKRQLIKYLSKVFNDLQEYFKNTKETRYNEYFIRDLLEVHYALDQFLCEYK